VLDFTSPEMGIKYIESAYNQPADECPTVLLLDFNMPLMDGWEFLDRYSRIDNYVKNQFMIYLVSSSINPGDNQKAAEHKYVKGFLIKPFRQVMVEETLRSNLLPSV
jgi:CheY-like chemotaxis protein